MDNSKKASFVKAYKRQNFAKGGHVKKLPRIKYFEAGGTALASPTTAGTNSNASNPNTGIMGTIGGALGLNNNFQASGANTTAGTNVNQLNDAYTQAQYGLQQQQGLSNQFSGQAAPAIQEQANLANQYQDIINGKGPNPAQAELAQNTAQNVNQQAALMAGQRGANANAGLMARQIAQQGAGVQQQAVGQAATLQAQQQIAAQQNLAGLAAQQAGQAANSVAGYNQAVQNEQGQLQGANTAYNNANVGMQSNINSTNAATAAGNQGVMGSILGGIAGGASSVLGSLAEGGEVPEHVKMAEMNATSMHHMKKMAWGGPLPGNPLVGNQVANTMAPPMTGGYMAPMASSGPQISSMAMPDNSASNDALSEGITNGLTDAFKSKKPDGGPDPFNSEDSSDVSELPEASTIGKHVSNQEWAKGGQICEGPLCGHVANFLAQGGKTDKVPAMVSPGEIYLNPEQVHKVMSEGTDPAKIGLKFKGKAKVKGDSYSNDTIPTTLESGGVVIDRKNMGTREKRELFVHRTMAKKKAGG